jgi:hypothetical protein
MLFRKQVWCWKGFLNILQSNSANWLFENWASASQNCFWLGKVLEKFGDEPTG